MDGSVEAEFEGPRLRVEEMRLWCQEGPTFARVDAVETSWLDTDAGYEDFDIR
jgi:acylphosphatase